MTRLTNAFSKKWENLQAAYALWFAFYNFCRVHETLRISPAMEAGIADHVWTLGGTSGELEREGDTLTRDIFRLNRGGVRFLAVGEFIFCDVSCSRNQNPLLLSCAYIMTIHLKLQSHTFNRIIRGFRPK